MEAQKAADAAAIAKAAGEGLQSTTVNVATAVLRSTQDSRAMREAEETITPEEKRRADRPGGRRDLIAPPATPLSGAGQSASASGASSTAGAAMNAAAGGGGSSTQRSSTAGQAMNAAATQPASGAAGRPGGRGGAGADRATADAVKAVKAAQKIGEDAARKTTRTLKDGGTWPPKPDAGVQKPRGLRALFGGGSGRAAAGSAGGGVGASEFATRTGGTGETQFGGSGGGGSSGGSGSGGGGGGAGGDGDPGRFPWVPVVLILVAATTYLVKHGEYLEGGDRSKTKRKAPDGWQGNLQVSSKYAATGFRDVITNAPRRVSHTGSSIVDSVIVTGDRIKARLTGEQVPSKSEKIKREQVCIQVASYHACCIMQSRTPLAVIRHAFCTPPVSTQLKLRIHANAIPAHMTESLAVDAEASVREEAEGGS